MQFPNSVLQNKKHTLDASPTDTFKDGSIIRDGAPLVQSGALYPVTPSSNGRNAGYMRVRSINPTTPAGLTQGEVQQSYSLDLDPVPASVYGGYSPNPQTDPSIDQAGMSPEQVQAWTQYAAVFQGGDGVTPPSVSEVSHWQGQVEQAISNQSIGIPLPDALADNPDWGSIASSLGLSHVGDSLGQEGNLKRVQAHEAGHIAAHLATGGKVVAGYTSPSGGRVVSFPPPNASLSDRILPAVGGVIGEMMAGEHYGRSSSHLGDIFATAQLLHPATVKSASDLTSAHVDEFYQIAEQATNAGAIDSDLYSRSRQVFEKQYAFVTDGATGEHRDRFLNATSQAGIPDSYVNPYGQDLTSSTIQVFQDQAPTRPIATPGKAKTQTLPKTGPIAPSSPAVGRAGGNSATPASGGPVAPARPAQGNPLAPPPAKKPAKPPAQAFADELNKQSTDVDDNLKRSGMPVPTAFTAAINNAGYTPAPGTTQNQAEQQARALVRQAASQTMTRDQRVRARIDPPRLPQMAANADVPSTIKAEALAMSSDVLPQGRADPKNELSGAEYAQAHKLASDALQAGATTDRPTTGSVKDQMTGLVRATDNALRKQVDSIIKDLDTSDPAEYNKNVTLMKKVSTAAYRMIDSAIEGIDKSVGGKESVGALRQNANANLQTIIPSKEGRKQLEAMMDGSDYYKDQIKALGGIDQALRKPFVIAGRDGATDKDPDKLGLSYAGPTVFGPKGSFLDGDAFGSLSSMQGFRQMGRAFRATVGEIEQQDERSAYSDRVFALDSGKGLGERQINASQRANFQRTMDRGAADQYDYLLSTPARVFENDRNFAGAAASARMAGGAVMAGQTLKMMGMKGDLADAASGAGVLAGAGILGAGIGTALVNANPLGLFSGVKDYYHGNFTQEDAIHTAEKWNFGIQAQFDPLWAKDAAQRGIQQGASWITDTRSAASKNADTASRYVGENGFSAISDNKDVTSAEYAAGESLSLLQLTGGDSMSYASKKQSLYDQTMAPLVAENDAKKQKFLTSSTTLTPDGYATTDSASAVLADANKAGILSFDDLDKKVKNDPSYLAGIKGIPGIDAAAYGLQVNVDSLTQAGMDGKAITSQAASYAASLGYTPGTEAYARTMQSYTHAPTNDDGSINRGAFVSQSTADQLYASRIAPASNILRGAGVDPSTLLTITQSGASPQDVASKADLVGAASAAGGLTDSTWNNSIYANGQGNGGDSLNNSIAAQSSADRHAQAKANVAALSAAQDQLGVARSSKVGGSFGELGAIGLTPVDIATDALKVSDPQYDTYKSILLHGAASGDDTSTSEARNYATSIAGSLTGYQGQTLDQNATSMEAYGGDYFKNVDFLYGLTGTKQSQALGMIAGANNVGMNLSDTNKDILKHYTETHTGQQSSTLTSNQASLTALGYAPERAYNELAGETIVQQGRYTNAAQFAQSIGLNPTTTASQSRQFATNYTDLQQQQTQGIANQLIGLGATSESAMGQAFGMGPMSNYEARQAGRRLSGDPYMISQFARTDEGKKEGAVATVNDLGQPIYQAQQWSLEAQSHSLGYNESQYQLGIQEQRTQQQGAFTFGGSFQNPFTGQTENVEGGGSLGIAESQANTGFAQTETNFGFQRQDMAKQRSQFYETQNAQNTQSTVQYEASKRDWSYSEDQNQLSFGWQMEDFDRNIKYARGRDRQDLIRQKNRAVVTETMTEAHSQDEKGRIEEQRKYELQSQDRAKKFFEQDAAMQATRLNTDVQYYQLNKTYQLESMNNQRKQATLEQSYATQQNEHARQLNVQQEALYQKQLQISHQITLDQEAQQYWYQNTLPQLLAAGQSDFAAGVNSNFQTMLTSLSGGLANLVNSFIGGSSQSRPQPPPNSASMPNSQSTPAPASTTNPLDPLIKAIFGGSSSQSTSSTASATGATTADVKKTHDLLTQAVTHLKTLTQKPSGQYTVITNDTKAALDHYSSSFQ